MRPGDVPLCVDLDGTLVATDLFVESLVALLARAPWYVVLVPWWLLDGRAALKREVSRRSPIDPAYLPYRIDVLEWLRAQANAGRPVYLATGADDGIARAVAGFTRCFAGVVASDGQRNLTGRFKAAVLCERFGERGFDYAGNHAVDVAVWRRAREALVVGPSSLARRAATVARIGMHWQPADAAIGSRLAAALAALRPHQWVKNVLVVVPLIAAHRAAEADLWFRAGLAFVAFSLVASGVYMLNDLADLASDRRHPRKRGRPLAAGRLPLMAGVLLAPLALAAGATVSFLLPAAFAGWLLAYLIVTTAYTLALKRIAGIDVAMLAGLYALRLAAGAAATGIVLSGWLIAFSGCLFLSLALVKREVELHAVRRAGGDRAHGRAYRLAHLRHVRIAGGLAALGAIGVLAVYVLRPDVTALYRHPTLLWLGCPVIAAWLLHMWRRTAHGHVHDDPVIFALRDPLSYATIAALAVIMLVAA
ncbi:MAG: UbiA family prenyltransferase [Casimicrobiaceae bacterium]